MARAGDPIDYTSFLTTNDLFVNPYSFGVMANCDRTNAAGQPLKCNVLVQDQCSGNLVDHIGLASNGVVYSGIRQALEHKPVRLDCTAL
ncbi:hypothetical protein ATI61_1292 [Archangium gephyra]|uniref:Uncharacterized protein n=1 Tax=Archangium gephyra TaxID=48 RepID=A0AAC8TKK7_9BACT|nr:hypothetical protein [Archangium gephyra]AKJ08341.1 Hypothetical protein AA314_09967 [Archangium gephyra]REG14261.1 hypothetical protein ATI61_1292 [Archangium gephyra]